MAPCPISRSPSHYRGEDYTVEKTEGRTEPKEKKLETTVSVSAVHEDDDEALDDEKPQLVKQFSCRLFLLMPPFFLTLVQSSPPWEWLSLFST